MVNLPVDCGQTFKRVIEGNSGSAKLEGGVERKIYTPEKEDRGEDQARMKRVQTPTKRRVFAAARRDEAISHAGPGRLGRSTKQRNTYLKTEKK